MEHLLSRFIDYFVDNNEWLVERDIIRERKIHSERMREKERDRDWGREMTLKGKLKWGDKTLFYIKLDLYCVVP